MRRRFFYRHPAKSGQHGFLLAALIGAISKRPGSGGGGGSDPFFADVELLLHMDGVDLSTSFPDSSLNGHTVTANGGAVVTANVVKYGTGGCNMSNATAHLTCNIGAFNPRTDQWCAEGWGRVNGSGSNAFFSGGAAGVDFYLVNLAGTLYLGDGVTNIIATSSFAGLSASNYTHWAVTFDGTTYRIFFSGTLGPSTTSLLKSVSISQFFVGAYPSVDSYMLGYQDDFRLTVGNPRYTSNFTPPTGPFPNS